jgi:hypothetical protein
MSDPSFARRSFTLRAGLILGALALTGPLLPGAPAVPPPVRGGECWVLIDLDAFYCGLCLDALTAFCRAVPSVLQEERLRGILLLRPPSASGSDAVQLRIALKKWDGFRKANDIRFPVFCDEGRLFAARENGGRIVLLDPAGRVLRGFGLPLKPKELAQVLSFLGQ